MTTAATTIGTANGANGATLPVDAWVLPVLQRLVSAEAFVQLRAAATESYWELAVARGWVSDERILQGLTARYRLKLSDFSAATPQVRDFVPEALARKYRVLPLTMHGPVVELATSNPHDLDNERALVFALGRRVRFSLAAPGAIRERLDLLYRPENVIEKIITKVAGKYNVESIADIVEDSPLELETHRTLERPVIQLVDRIVAEGIQSRASDIHLEPEETGIAIRYRIDGVMRNVMVLPRVAGVPLVSRVKIMANLDIADRLRPQDGRARVTVNGHRVDLRVSTLPSSNGEKVVMRILDQRSTTLSLDALGYNTNEMERIQSLVGAQDGIVLVTGPTGSGKTTTLYSMLRAIQARGLNIVTVEDPVEYRLAGIVQVQVNEKAGLTFPAALRSILRQDPDVLLVGEIRDRETANIAIQASLTGHLVFSTLHTIDAASSVTRLLDIGIERYKIAGALKGVVSQRLLRRLCVTCRAPAGAPPAHLAGIVLPPDARLHRAVGCPECAGTGYRGRLAVTEVLVIDAVLERGIAGTESAAALTAAARLGGMATIWESGVRHAVQGSTTLEEVARVLTQPIAPPTLSPVAPPPLTPLSAARPVAQVRESLIGPRADGRREVLVEAAGDSLRAELRAILERHGFAVREPSSPSVAPR